MDTSYTFGSIDNYILFGGGKNLYAFARILKEYDYPVVLFSSERHLQECVAGEQNLGDAMEDLGIPYYLSETIGTEERVSEYLTSGTLGMSFSAPWLFKKEFIDRFEGRLLNSHDTLLPRYQGAGGYSWMIMKNNRMGCSVIHQIDPGIDTGNIVTYKKYIYPPSCSIPADYAQFALEQDTALYRAFIEEIRACNTFMLTMQQADFAVYFPRLNTEMQAYIDWSWDTRSINGFICAFDDPYKGASSFIEEKRLFLKKSCEDYHDGPFHPFQCGLVYRKTDDALFVATRDGGIVIREVRDEEGKNMFSQIYVGDRFHTPGSYIEAAKSFRPFYDGHGLQPKKKIWK